MHLLLLLLFKCLEIMWVWWCGIECCLIRNEPLTAPFSSRCYKASTIFKPLSTVLSSAVNKFCGIKIKILGTLRIEPGAAGWDPCLDLSVWLFINNQLLVSSFLCNEVLDSVHHSVIFLESEVLWIEVICQFLPQTTDALEWHSTFS